MSVTNFPNGVTSFGVPILGGQGLMTQGKSIFVKPKTGSDGNSGLSADHAVATLAQALTLATANQNDVIYLFAESNTAANTTDYQSATLTWNKDLVHLVGIAPPIAFSQRARIAQLSTATGVSPLITVSANGCQFRNIEIFHGVADATSLIALKVTGQRNYFYNCHIAGIGDATMVTSGARSLVIDGGAENVFERCTIGLDTITRDNTVTEVELKTAATRNIFRDCIFIGFISNAGYTHVTVTGTTGIDRMLLFERCLFITESANDATSQTSVTTLPALTQGYVVFKDCMLVSPGASGNGDWDGSNRGKCYANMVAPAAAAVGGIATKQ